MVVLIAMIVAAMLSSFQDSIRLIGGQLDYSAPGIRLVANLAACNFLSINDCFKAG